MNLLQMINVEIREVVIDKVDTVVTLVKIVEVEI